MRNLPGPGKRCAAGRGPAWFSLPRISDANALPVRNGFAFAFPGPASTCPAVDAGQSLYGRAHRTRRLSEYCRADQYARRARRASACTEPVRENNSAHSRNRFPHSCSHIDGSKPGRIRDPRRYPHGPAPHNRGQRSRPPRSIRPARPACHRRDHRCFRSLSSDGPY